MYEVDKTVAVTWHKRFQSLKNCSWYSKTIIQETKVNRRLSILSSFGTVIVLMSNRIFYESLSNHHLKCFVRFHLYVTYFFIHFLYISKIQNSFRYIKLLNSLFSLKNTTKACSVLTFFLHYIGSNDDMYLSACWSYLISSTEGSHISPSSEWIQTWF